MYEDETGRRNASGLPDPTAARAVSRAAEDAEALERMSRFRRAVCQLAACSGLYVRLEVTDKRTGAVL